MELIFVFWIWAMFATIAVGIVFMADALLFGFTGRSFIGMLDKVIK